MNSSPEPIKLQRPLRDVRSAGPPPMSGPSDPALQDQWQASYDLGRIEGEKALSEQLLRQRAEMHEIMSGVLNALRQAVPQVVRDTENTLVSLALEVAQKLVSEMPISVPMIETSIRDALAQVEGTAQITVRLHPADLELLQKSDSPMLVAGNSGGEFRFLGSPEVTRGGCLVQTRVGTVDARRETKFDLIKRNLLS